MLFEPSLDIRTSHQTSATQLVARERSAPQKLVSASSPEPQPADNLIHGQKILTLVGFHHDLRFVAYRRLQCKQLRATMHDRSTIQRAKQDVQRAKEESNGDRTEKWCEPS